MRPLLSRLLLISLTGSLSLVPLSAWACPSCSEALADSAGGGRLLQGWTQSIALLMAAPYLVFGGVTFWIIRSIKREKQGGVRSKT